tara:strand:- start:262 stop:684 length:423 start_codon:yes stop_codon:yes gene_type:complete
MLIFNILATLAIPLVLVPAVFKGRMKDSVEITWLIAALMSMAFSLLFLVKPCYFTSCCVISTLCLTFSKQGRYFYIEVMLLPLEIANRTYHMVKNSFLEDQTIYNFRWFHEVKTTLKDNLEACSNWDMDKKVALSAEDGW